MQFMKPVILSVIRHCQNPSDFTNNFLSTCYKISVNKTKLYILCLYRAPNGNLNQFIEQLESTLLYLESTR
jgi:hypothetical protein